VYTYEYRVIHYRDTEDVVKGAMELAKSGWELVSVTPSKEETFERNFAGFYKRVKALTEK